MTASATTRARRRNCSKRAATASTSMKRGTATPVSIRCMRATSRCVAILRRTGRHNLRHALHAQAAGGPVAGFVHPYSGRPRRHRPSAVQPSLHDAYDHVAALPDRGVERHSLGNDGRPRGLFAHPGGDPGGRRFPANSRAHPQELSGEERLVLQALERGNGDGSANRPQDRTSRMPRRDALHAAGPWMMHPSRQLAWLRGHGAELVHARPGQGEHPRARNGRRRSD